MLFDNPTINTILVILLFVCIWVYVLRLNTHATKTLVQQVARQQSNIRQNDEVRSLCRAIHYLHPTIHAGIDYIVKEGGPGEGAFIEEWFNSTVPQPNPEELEQALKTISGIDPTKDHAAQRLKEYPSVGDQLDAAYKARRGDHSEQIRLDTLISQVKEKYPKSDENL